MPASWLDIPADSPFSLANIPFGIISVDGTDRRDPAIAIGNYAFNLYEFAINDGFSSLTLQWDPRTVFKFPTLNSFGNMPAPDRREVRTYIQSVFASETPYPDALRDNEINRAALHPLRDVTTHIPFDIGDYTDFYVGFNHASNCSKLFGLTLHPNYHHLPVAYHGRASSVVVSGTPIRRPWGQYLSDPTQKDRPPVFDKSTRFDYELELGAFIGRFQPSSKPDDPSTSVNEHGYPLSTSEAADSIFGYVLLNDWSARDVQTWEMPPLGPFNSKNLGTSISPWVVVPEALAPYRVSAQQNEKEWLPYLREPTETRAYDMELEVLIQPSKADSPTKVAESNARHLLWSFPQMLAHHTITGCPMRVGDLLGSGTISGEVEGSEGCLLEQTKGGKVAVNVGKGEERLWLEDGDCVVFRGFAGAEGERVGFGECRGVVLPALER